MKPKKTLKGFVLLLMIILFSMSSLAWKETYSQGEDILIEDAIVLDGIGAWCNITIYQNESLVQTANMTRHGLAYTHDAGVAGINLTEDYYVCNIECNISNSTFTGSCDFEVVNNMEFVYLFFLAIIVGFAVLTSNFVLELLAGILVMIFGILVLLGDVAAMSDTLLLNQGIGISAFLIGLYILYLGLFNVIKGRKEGKKKK